jgi:ubiquitin C-terminal hydrolase
METQHGLSGLCNLGNTCYVNSIMQILSHTEVLNKILNKEMCKKTTDGIFMYEWRCLKDLMWSENSTIRPSRWIDIIHKTAKIKKNENFSINSQNDVCEFLVFVLDTFHNALSSKQIKIARCRYSTRGNACYLRYIALYSKNYSSIIKNFYAMESVQLLNDKNEIINENYEPFSIIYLNIPTQEITLAECFDKYCEPERICGENALLNEKTNKKEEVIKKVSFWSLPEILIISLNRYTSDLNKNNILVKFPYSLSLKKYVSGPNKLTYVYKLYAVCNHSGGYGGGHYTSYIKCNNKWYLFNDTIVKLVAENEIVTTKAYCLFYKKVLI